MVTPLSRSVSGCDHAGQVEPNSRIPVGDLADYIQRINDARNAQGNEPQHSAPVGDLLQAAVCGQLLQRLVHVPALEDGEHEAGFAEGLGQQRHVHDVQLLGRVAEAQDDDRRHHRPHVVCHEVRPELGTRELPEPGDDPRRHTDFLGRGGVPRRVAHDSSRRSIALDRR
ncbi:hypothetical protein PG996_008045 [Apiospora saccharicola]|uniref:Uncharacterized protein n=1 Tax=Apiospora saccharicola TaxID=335842 RepID=A0ABR1V012_9PEZI